MALRLSAFYYNIHLIFILFQYSFSFFTYFSLLLLYNIFKLLYILQ